MRAMEHDRKADASIPPIASSPSTAGPSAAPADMAIFRLRPSRWTRSEPRFDKLNFIIPWIRTWNIHPFWPSSKCTW